MCEPFGIFTSLSLLSKNAKHTRLNDMRETYLLMHIERQHSTIGLVARPGCTTRTCAGVDWTETHRNDGLIIKLQKLAWPST